MSKTPKSTNSPRRARTSLFGRMGVAVFSLGLAMVSVFTQGSMAAAATSTLDTSSLQKLTNGLAWFALLTCIGGIVVSASMWALGSKGQNAGTELIGKKGFIVCLTAAFFIGAVNPMIEWLDKKASSSDVDKAGVTKFQPYTYSNTPSAGRAVGGAAGGVGSGVGAGVGNTAGGIGVGAGAGNAAGDLAGQLGGN
jgi:hypothetical protein